MLSYLHISAHVPGGSGETCKWIRGRQMCRKEQWGEKDH